MFPLLSTFLSIPFRLGSGLEQKNFALRFHCTFLFVFWAAVFLIFSLLNCRVPSLKYSVALARTFLLLYRTCT